MTRRPAITADPAFVLQRAIFACQLRAYRAENGAVQTGVVVEAALAAIAQHLRAEHGPEVAFETFARWADAMSEPLLATNPGEQA